jgi:hypothetical protein
LNFPGRGRPKERRKKARSPAPAFKAFYWTGGLCLRLRVCDIGEGGAYIETGADWCVGTVIHLVLECDGQGQSSSKAAFGLWARIVYIDFRGMGMEFDNMDRQQQRQFQQFLETGIGVSRLRDECFRSVRRGRQTW